MYSTRIWWHEWCSRKAFIIIIIIILYIPNSTDYLQPRGLLQDEELQVLPTVYPSLSAACTHPHNGFICGIFGLHLFPLLRLAPSIKGQPLQSCPEAFLVCQSLLRPLASSRGEMFVQPVFFYNFMFVHLFAQSMLRIWQKHPAWKTSIALTSFFAMHQHSDPYTVLTNFTLLL